jgi:hypothetical protein
MGRIIRWIKQLFCRHLYVKKSNSYCDLGWEICLRCEKHKYSVKDLEYTHFKIK